MMRRGFHITLAGLAIGALVACGGGDGGGGRDGGGPSSLSATAWVDTLADYPVSPLSPAEADSLAYMREEEQLAHDVYAMSTTLWPTAVFSNIATSEATHSAAMKALLDRYQQADPLAGLPNGRFKTPAFQALYNDLVQASRISLIEALKVGVQIEELDMRDIVAQTAAIDNADIRMVYDNLLRGSRNHLRAYMKVLTQQGGTYVPQYITQAEFDAIVGSAVEKGS